MRRGQLTLILIVAALVLLSGLFVLYLAGLATPDPQSGPQSEVDTRAAARLCLEQFGRQAVLQALVQGGVNEPYWSERGNVATLDFGSKTRTAYERANGETPERGEGAVRGTDTTPSGFPDAWAPQEYLPVDGTPARVWIFRGRDYINNWSGSDAVEFTQRTPANGPYLGLLRPEPLCANRGFNQRGVDDRAGSACLPGTYGSDAPDRQSWQEALESSITAAVQNDPLCPVDSPVIVAIGEDDVTFISGEDSATVPVQLKRMYNLAFNLAKYELADPGFEPASVRGTTPGDPGHVQIFGCQDSTYGSDCAVPGLVVTVASVSDPFERLDESEDADAYPWNGLLDDSVFELYGDAWRQNATIITITDTNVRIDGQSPRLRFVVKNRYPVALSGGTVTGDYLPLDQARFSIGALDPDGVPIAFACVNTTENPLLGDVCDGTATLGPFAVDNETVTAFCNDNRPVQGCVPTPGCSQPVPLTGVRSVFCSTGERTEASELVPSGWEAWTSYPDDGVPRNCRVTAAPVLVQCLVAQDPNLPTDTCFC